jgi:hypothetical protein
MEYEPILALFQRFELFFEARIWIRIPINVLRIHNTAGHVIFVDGTATSNYCYYLCL